MTEENTGEDTEMSKYELKKLVGELEDIRGRNTELVSLYIPAGYDMSKISDFITSEASEAENIKSKHTRKNVQAALDKIGRKVKEEQETPENGVAFFAGNVSDTEGRPEYEVWEVVPPQPIESRRYRCDKEFVVEPLKEMIVDDRVYGLIVVDKNNAAIGYLQGSSVKTVYSMSSEVPGKTRAGGQCLAPESIVQMADGRLKQIKDVEVGERVKVADFQEMGLKSSRVTDKWSEEKEVYQIETKFPRKTLKASADHEVFTTDKGIEKKAVEELSEGEKLVFPEKVDAPGMEQAILSNRYYNSYKVSDRGREKIRNERQAQNLSQKQLGERTGRTQTAVSKLESGERDIKRDFLETVCEELGLEFSDFIQEYCRGKNFELPRTVDPELAQIIGYFIGDGSFDPERLNFHENNREVAENYQELLEGKFDCNTSIRFREDKNYFNLRAFGKPLVRYIENEFPEVKKSHDSQIPSKILRADTETLSGFIKGLYDAEGHCSAERGRVGLSANNEILIHQLQSALLRLGVTASLTSYDNSENPYSDKTRYTVSISDQQSLENFGHHVSFTAERKRKELEKLTSGHKTKNNNRQVIRSGQEVREIIEENGKTIEDFKSANTYLQGKREISAEAFKRNFVQESEGELKSRLEEITEPDLLPTKISSIRKVGEREVIDISVEAGNFVANNLVVHNSAQRFARIRKEMLKNFLEEINENAKKAFLEKAREGKLLGIIVGGPGFVKEKLLDNHLHQELKDEVIATESINYSGEEALKELVRKAEDSIQDAQVVKEKKLVNEFFDNLKEENGKSEYGLKQVKKALEMGAVETVLVSEDLNTYRALYECGNGHEDEAFEQKPEIAEEKTCPECGEDMELKEMSDVIDIFGEKAEEMGSDLEIISTDHEEGQRLLNMGGIAAIMRYRIR